MNNKSDLPESSPKIFSNLPKDITASIVVFLVALPLCLGIALASGAPLFSGLLAGIIGGIVVGTISGSHSSVSGPAAGLTAIVAAQIASLGSFQAFLLAVFFAGIIQIGMGLARAGALSAFFPSSVIKGLLAAIGVILIMKQIPHVFGHDKDPEGEMSFSQPDNENTFSELLLVFEDIHWGATLIGIVSIVLLVLWQRIKILKTSIVPGPLVVVILGVVLQGILANKGVAWSIDVTHLVQIPVAETAGEFFGFLTFPDFKEWANPGIYTAAITIAIVASLETLLNLEAVDKLDPERKRSPPSRELIAQGIGNTVGGLIGALPVTAVVVRGSVNVSVGAKSKLSAILHGILLLVCVAIFPIYLNRIPLASLAAILLVTGFSLVNPKLILRMWNEGKYRFIPFIATVLSIVFTDLLIGILIGLGVAMLFILISNLRLPIRRILEKHIGGDVLHIELANQVSFLKRASLDKIFADAENGSSILIDATETDYIDPDVLGLIRDFKTTRGPANGVTVSLRGFRDKYNLKDDIQFADYSTRELQDKMKPEQVLQVLQDGNIRFQNGTLLTRDFRRQVDETAGSQTPIAAILSCIDSRVPAELVFDLGIGDIFSVRVAGNVIGSKSLGSLEYGVGVAGVKLVVVLGHTRCGAVTSSVQLVANNKNAAEVTGCEHLHTIVDEIAPSINKTQAENYKNANASEQESVVDEVAKLNVMRTVNAIIQRSQAIKNAVDNGSVLVVGAIYDVKTGHIEFIED
jgi:carbonic anhydrase/SulP family sulfate permease